MNITARSNHAPRRAEPASPAERARAARIGSILGVAFGLLGGFLEAGQYAVGDVASRRYAIWAWCVPINAAFGFLLGRLFGKRVADGHGRGESGVAVAVFTLIGANACLFVAAHLWRKAFGAGLWYEPSTLFQLGPFVHAVFGLPVAIALGLAWGGLLELFLSRRSSSPI